MFSVSQKMSAIVALSASILISPLTQANDLAKYNQIETKQSFARLMNDSPAVSITSKASIRETYLQNATNIVSSSTAAIAYNYDSPYMAVFLTDENGDWEEVSEFDLSILIEDDVQNMSLRNVVINDANSVVFNVNYFTDTSSYSLLMNATIDESGEISLVSTMSNSGYYSEQIHIGDDHVIKLSNNEISAYSFDGVSTGERFTNGIDYVNNVSTVKVDAKNKRIFYAKYTYSSEPAAALEVYKYDLVNGELSFELDSTFSVQSEIGRYSYYQVLTDSENGRAVFMSDDTGYMAVVELNTGTDSYELVNELDISGIVSYPDYFSFNNAAFHDDVVLRYRGNTLEAFAIEGSVVRMKSTLDIGDISYPTVEATSNGLFVFERERALKHHSYDKANNSFTSTDLTNAIFMDSIELSLLYDEDNILVTYNTNARSFSVFDIGEDTLSFQASFEMEEYFPSTFFYGDSMKTLNDKFLVLVDDRLIEIGFEKNSSGDVELLSNVSSFEDEQGNPISLGYYSYDVDLSSGYLALTGYDSLTLFKKQNNVFEQMIVLRNGASNVENLSGIGMVDVIGDHVYVVSNNSETLSMIALSDDGVTIKQQLQNPIFARSSDKLHNQGQYLTYHALGTSVALEVQEDGNLAVASYSITQGYPRTIDSWNVFTQQGGYYEDELVSIYQIDPDTGFWGEANIIDIKDNEYYGNEYIVVGNYLLIYTQDSVDKIEMFDLTRRPIAKSVSHEILINQGDSSTTDLTDYFVELDEDDSLEISIEDELASLGFELSNGVLTKTDVMTFGQISVEVMAKDSQDFNATTTLAISVNRMPQLNAELPSINNLINTAFSADLGALFVDDQDQTITFSIVSGNRDDVTLTEDGMLSGNIATAGTYTMGLNVADNLGAVNQLNLSIVITNPPVAEPPPAAESGGSGGSLNFYLIAFMIAVIGSRKVSLTTRK